VVEDFARYLYLPRLAGPEVVVKAMRDGVALLTWQADGFGYAESFDDKSGRFRGLRGGRVESISADDAGLLVKPATARAQMDAEVVPPPPGPSNRGPSLTTDPVTPESPVAPTARVLRRFHGTVALDAARTGRDAGKVSEEVIAHLAGLPGAEVSVTLQIEVHLPGGASEQTVRTVTENARTLRFTSQAFEED
jgi:hypothetical protein